MAPDPWGHLFQVPYVMVWQDLVENPPKWLKPFIHKPPSSSNSQVLVMETPPPPGGNQKERGPKTSLSGIVLSKPDRHRNGDEASTICALLAIPSEKRILPRGLRGPTGTDHEGRLALGTRGRTRGDRGGLDPGDQELPSSTVQALSVRVGPANQGGERTYQYWPFSTSDLYNWKTQNPPFS